LRQDAPDSCPNCGGRNWRFAGYGIERAYSEFARVFPQIPLFRMDKDAAKEEGADRVVAAFTATSPACLLATRMVMGFGGIPQVGVVGVLSCDTLLNLPDYRAAEKVFHQLWSLREIVHPDADASAFVAQSYNLENHGVNGVVDPKTFYRIEQENRRLLGYPPFKRFFKIRFSGRNPDRVREGAAAFVTAALVEAGDVDVLGPSPAPKPKVRQDYRWQVALRGPDGPAMTALVRRAAAAVPGGVRMSVDVDPVDMA
jgi:primosomal protein N' (replication factor Y)